MASLEGWSFTTKLHPLSEKEDVHQYEREGNYSICRFFVNEGGQIVSFFLTFLHGRA